MRFLKRLIIILHAVILLAIGSIFVLMYFNVLTPDNITQAVSYIYNQPDIKLVFGIAGVLFVAGGLLMAQINLGKLQTEKTIAFDNPEGQVTVSLSAIEDFIKKSIRHIEEVKELRANVTASKRGINISCKATIFADTNIPEITERIQNIVKAKVRDMLGVEEAINIKINVIKISLRGKGENQPAPIRANEETSRRMPFGDVDVGS
ncbi:MAG: alkaline shock response membrane anchor protein AmaP [Candidatus Omnitrophica bacterium]|nr:alkaline shock response membrane anchor protein AmaP [Candidatus Omnitrophota bacterium]